MRRALDVPPVADRVRGALKAAGLSQRRAAKRLGWHHSTLYCRLSGRATWTVPQAAALIRILQDEGLEVGYDDIFGTEAVTNGDDHATD